MASAKKPPAMKARKAGAARRPTAPPVPKGTKRPTGRPRIHTPELAKRVCDLIMSGKSLRAVCEMDAMPDRQTVLNWIHEDTAGFFGQYRRACAIRTEVHRDECQDIADEGVRHVVMEWSDAKGKTRRVPVMVSLDANEIRHRELRIRTRQWDMIRQAPKVYGDKVGITDGDGNAAGLLVFIKDLSGRKD